MTDNRPSNVCKFYLTEQGCKFGSNCKFTHSSIHSGQNNRGNIKNKNENNNSFKPAINNNLTRTNYTSASSSNYTSASSAPNYTPGIAPNYTSARSAANYTSASSAANYTLKSGANYTTSSSSSYSAGNREPNYAAGNRLPNSYNRTNNSYRHYILPNPEYVLNLIKTKEIDFQLIFNQLYGYYKRNIGEINRVSLKINKIRFPIDLEYKAINLFSLLKIWRFYEHEGKLDTHISTEVKNTITESKLIEGFNSLITQCHIDCKVCKEGLGGEKQFYNYRQWCSRDKENCMYGRHLQSKISMEKMICIYELCGLKCQCLEADEYTKRVAKIKGSEMSYDEKVRQFVLYHPKIHLIRDLKYKQFSLEKEQKFDQDLFVIDENDTINLNIPRVRESKEFEPELMNLIKKFKKFYRKLKEIRLYDSLNTEDKLAMIRKKYNNFLIKDKSKSILNKNYDDFHHSSLLQKI